MLCVVWLWADVVSSASVLTVIIRGGAEKSLARPGRKQATATKLGIYSTYSTRSSIHFLARWSTFGKSLKKIQNAVQPTWSPRPQWPPRRTKNGDLLIIFSVQRTGGSPTGPDPENRVCDKDNESPDRPVSSGLQVPGEPGNFRARTRTPRWYSRGVYPSKYPSIAPVEMSNTPRWQFGHLEDNQWRECRLDPPQKIEARTFPADFCTRNIWAGWAAMSPLHWLLLCLRVITI